MSANPALPEIPLPFFFNDDDPNVKLWTFVVYCFVVAIVSIFYLFYLNRGLVQLFFFVLRIYTWRRYKAWIEMESMAFAILTGKIMFRNFRYFSRNESIYILRGHITFRFWAKKVRSEENPDKSLPCRIKMRLDGLEWFIYNRNSVFNELRRNLERERNGDVTEASIKIPESPLKENFNLEKLKTDKDKMFRDMLPIEIIGNTGSIMIGNPDLPSIFIFHYKSVTGCYETSKASSSNDLYSWSLNMNFTKPQIKIRSNVDYREPNLPEIVNNYAKHQKTWWKMVKGILFREASEEEVPFINRQWEGLARYKVGQKQNDNEKNYPEEYAKVSNILVGKEARVVYFCDVAGPYLGGDLNSTRDDPAPQWRLDLDFEESSWNYGPWAHRQVGIIQKYFFPNSYRDFAQTVTPRLGDSRLFAEFKIELRFNGSSMLRIPFRDFSKDFLYRKSATREDESPMDLRNFSSQRSYAWMDARIASESNLVFRIPLIVKSEGYCTHITSKMSIKTIKTSINYQSLAENLVLDLKANMCTPIKWNAEREWNYDINISNTRIFLLREHVTLLTDLSKDFAFSPSLIPFKFFVPMNYRITGRLLDYEIFMCVNQHNLIAVHNEFDENAFMVLAGKSLSFDILLPFSKYSPSFTEIPIEIDLAQSNVKFAFPRSHTLGAFLTEKGLQVGTVDSVSLEFKYLFNSGVQKGFVDTCLCTLTANGLSAMLTGYLIRYIINLKDNYFGDYTFPSRPHEDNEMYHDRAPDVSSPSNFKPSNEFEFSLIAYVNDAELFMPRDLYVQDTTCRIASPEVSVDVRYRNSMFDLQVNSLPIQISTPDWSAGSRSLVVVDGVEVRCNRFLGPLPKSLLYAVDWRFAIARIKGEVSSVFGDFAKKALSCFAFHFVDKDNELVAEPVLPDVTAMYLKVGQVDISVVEPQSIVIVSATDGILLETDNLITSNWVDRLSAVIPSLVVKSLAVVGTTKQIYADGTEKSIDQWAECLDFKTSLKIKRFLKRSNAKELREQQRQTVLSHDKQTRRASHLFDSKNEQDDQEESNALYDFEPPFSLEEEHPSRKPIDASFLDLETDNPNFTFAHASLSHSNDEEENEDEDLSHDVKGVFRVTSSTVDATKYKYLDTYTVKRCDLTRMTGDPWDYPKFSVIKPVTRHARHSSHDHHPSDSSHSAKLNQAAGFTVEDTEITAVFVIEATSPVRGFASPLLLKTIAPLVAANICDNKMDYEGIIDDAYLKYMEYIVRSTSPSVHNTIVTVVPQIHIHCIQDMQFPSSLFFASEQQQSPGAHKVQVMSNFDLSFDDVLLELDFHSSLKSEKTDNDLPAEYVNAFKINVSIDSVRTILRFMGSQSASGISGVPLSKRHYKNRDLKFYDTIEDYPVVLDLYCGNIAWSGTVTDSVNDQESKEINTIAMQVDELSVISVNEAVELMWGTCYTWALQSSCLLDAHEIDRINEKLMAQAFVNIMESAGMVNRAFSSDGPEFLTRPNELWSYGQKEYQKDYYWKFLNYLRYYSRQNYLNEQPVAIKDTFDKNLGKLMPLAKEWRSFSDGSDEIIKRHIGGTRIVPKLNVKTTDLAFEFFIGKLSVLLFDYQYKDGSIQLQEFKLNSGISSRNSELSCQNNLRVYSLDVDMNPSFFGFLKHVLRISSWFHTVGSANDSKGVVVKTSHSSKLTEVSVDAGIDNLSLLMEEGSVSAELLVRNFLIVFEQFKMEPDQELAHKFALSLLSLQFAASERIPSYSQSVRDPELLELTMTEFALKSSDQYDENRTIDAHVAALNTSLPRSLLKLYTFAERWYDEDFPSYHFLLKGLNNEAILLASAAATRGTQQTSPVNVNLTIKSLVFETFLLQSLKMVYNSENVLISSRSSPCAVSVLMNSQNVSLVSGDDEANGINTRLDLPTLHLTLTSMGDGAQQRAINLGLGMFEGVVSIDLLVRLIASYAVVAEELSEIIDTFTFNRTRKVRFSTSKRPETPTSPSGLVFSLSVDGISLRGLSPAASVLLEAHSVSASIDLSKQELGWDSQFEHLSVSLCHDASSSRLAQVKFDLKLTNDLESDQGVKKIVSCSHKMYSSLHPLALKRLIEFYLFYKSELSKQFVARSREIESLKNETYKLLATSNTSLDGTQAAALGLNEAKFQVEIEEFMLSIPLDKTEDSHQGSVTPGLVFGMQNINISIDSVSKLHAQLQDITAKFVLASDFDPQATQIDKLTSNNYCAFSKISMNLHKESIENRIIVNSEFKIFEFTIKVDPYFTEYFAQMTRFYEQGKAEFTSFFSAEPGTESAEADKSSHSLSNFYILDLNGVFDMERGRLKIVSVVKNEDEPMSAKSPTGGVAENYDQQEITLPVVLLRIGGKTTIGQNPVPFDPLKERFVDINLHIGPTENTVFPSVLLFVKEFTQSVRPSRASKGPRSPPAILSDSSSVAIENTSDELIENYGHNVSLSIVLDETKIHLSCQPIYKVVSTVSLDKVELFLSFAPRNMLSQGEYFVFRSIVSDFMFSLKHSFSPEVCMSLRVPEIRSFSSFAKDGGQLYKYSNKIDVETVSVVLSLRYLQDFFSFKYLWLDFEKSRTRAVKMQQLKDRLYQMVVALTSEYITLAQVKSVQLEVDLGQSIGKAIMFLENFQLENASVFTGEQVKKRNVSSTVDRVSLGMDGRVNGDALINSIKLTSASGQNDPCTLLQIAISAIEVESSYQLEKLLVGRIKDTLITVSDSWLRSGVPPIVTVNTKITVENSTLVVSRRTLPILGVMLKKTMHQIKEKRNSARSGGLRMVNSVNSKYLSTEGLNNLFQKSLESIIVYKENVVKPRGRLEIVLNDVSAIMMRHNFRDPEYAIASVGKMAFEFNLEPPSSARLGPSISEHQDVVREAIKLSVSSILIRKMTGKPISQGDERSWSQTQWFSTLTSQPAKTVISVPPFVTLFDSLVNFDSCEVGYGFSTEFSDQIDIALNFGLYKYLQNLFELYQSDTLPDRFIPGEESSPLEADARSILTSKRSGIDSESIARTKSLRRSSIGGESADIPDRSPRFEDASSQSSKIRDASKFEFVRQGELKFEPQLKLTGDIGLDWAIDWLGVNKEKLPQMVFTNVARPLQQIFDGVIRSAHAKVCIVPEDSSDSSDSVVIDEH